MSTENYVEQPTPSPEESKELVRARAEFHEKNEIFRAGQLRGPFDWHQLDLESFLDEMFMRHDLDLPFQEVLSPDYLLWRAQVEQQSISRALGEPVPPIDYSGFVHRQYNGIAVYWNPKRPWTTRKRKDGTKEKVKKFSHRQIFRDDPTSLNKIRGLEDCYMSPATYVGRKRRNSNARYLYAIGIDLDDVGPSHLLGLFKNASVEYIDQNGPVGHPYLPVPNIITNSGHGLHVYYLLAEPVALASQHVWKLMERIKDNLTSMVFKPNTTRRKKVERLALLQAFRLPETKTKFGELVTAWQCLGTAPYSIEELNKYFYKSDKLTKKEIMSIYRYEYSESKVTLDEAKRRWPEWYQARVVDKLWVSPEKKWHVKRAVYDWWKDKLWATKEEVVGHRFWCMMCLYIYAIKCDIPIEEVDADAEALLEHFESFTAMEADPKKHFSLSDVAAAATAYHINYNRFPVWKIDSLTGIRIERNKRNRDIDGRLGRRQPRHLKLARSNRDIITESKGKEVWWEGNGRARQASVVAEWRKLNPNCTNKSKCARECGLERHTVAKWWDAGDVTFNNTPAEIVAMWREQNPESHDRKQCAKDTLLALPTVEKYWPWSVAEKAESIIEKLPAVPVAYQMQLTGEELEGEVMTPNNNIKVVYNITMAKIFLPDAVSPVPGYTIDEVRQIVTSGKWKELGWDLHY